MKLCNIFYLFAVLIAPIAVRAQTNVIVQPNCFVAFTFTTTAASWPATPTTNGPGDNRQKGCSNWTMKYQSSGFSAVTLTLQSGASTSTTVSFGSFAGTTLTGSNPFTSTTGGEGTFSNSTATISWVRVNLAATGSGTVTGVLYGTPNGLANSGGAYGGAPCGSTVGQVQVYATATTFGCGNLFYDGSQYYIFGTSDFSGAGPDLSFVDNVFEIDPNQSMSSRIQFKAFNAPSFGSDLNALSISMATHVDSVTFYWDAQLGFAGIPDNSSNPIEPYVIGAEGHCVGANNCASLTDYDFFIINRITGHTLLENTNAAPNQLTVPAVTQLATLGNYVAAAQIISNDTADANPLLLSKNAIADSGPGASYVSFKAVAGTNAGTCKVVMKAGTSATPVTLIDNIGGSC